MSALRSAVARFACLAFVGLAGPAEAQKAPELGYVFPAGAKAGTSVPVRLGGYDWTPDMQLLVHDPRVKLDAIGPISEVLLPPPPYWTGLKSVRTALPLPRELPARFTLPPGLPPGPVRWQVANASGATATGVFMVGEGPELVEDEGRTGVQQLPSLPVTVSGRLFKLSEVDRYRFRATGGPVTCQLTSRGLGTDINAVIEVRDPAGRLVADAADTEGRDALSVTFSTVAGREYTVAVHDIEYRGDRSHTYRLELSPGPRVVSAVPASGRRGQVREVEFTGIGLETGGTRLETVKTAVAFPKDPVSTFRYRLQTPTGPAPAFVLGLSDLPEGAAGEGEISVPGALTGRLSPSGTVRHPFRAAKGQVLSIRAASRQLGGSLDLAVTLLGPDGKELARNDDFGGSADAGLEWTAPADGDFTLVITDSSGAGAAPAGVYRLSIELPRPGFLLSIPARVAVRVGEKAELPVAVTRRGGFTGPISLRVEGLPEGATVTGATSVPAAVGSAKLTLQAAPDAPAGASLITVSGAAMIDGVEVRQVATAPGGGLSPARTEDGLASAATVAITLKPPWKADVVDKDGGHRVPRGSTYPAEVTLVRYDGYTGDIILQMAAKQAYQVMGIWGPQYPVANGVTRTLYPCFMPEWLETSRTSRMILTAIGMVRDPRGNSRWVLTDVDGRITMWMEGALMKLAVDEPEPVLRPGATLDVRIRLQRSPKLPETARIELEVPPGLAGIVAMDPVEIAPGKEEAVLRIRTTDHPGLLGDHELVLKARALEGGKYAVVSQASVHARFSRTGRSSEFVGGAAPRVP